jgi:hypothetical protein
MRHETVGGTRRNHTTFSAAGGFFLDFDNTFSAAGGFFLDDFDLDGNSDDSRGIAYSSDVCSLLNPADRCEAGARQQMWDRCETAGMRQRSGFDIMICCCYYEVMMLPIASISGRTEPPAAMTIFFAPDLRASSTRIATQKLPTPGRPTCGWNLVILACQHKCVLVWAFLLRWRSSHIIHRAFFVIALQFCYLFAIEIWGDPISTILWIDSFSIRVPKEGAGKEARSKKRYFLSKYQTGKSEQIESM